VLEPFWRWWMGDRTESRQFPTLPFSLEDLTERHRAMLAADLIELERFVSILVGKSRRSERHHVLYVRRVRGEVRAESGCGRLWPLGPLDTVEDVNDVDCALCRDQLFRIGVL
jgi:hypothetical protein